MTSTELAIREDQQAFNDKQIYALKQLGVEDAHPGHLAIFFHQCVRTGLDPFAKQIYMIGRNSKNQKTQQWETKYTIQTGIDGYRLVARRAADRAGETLEYDDVLWKNSDGKWDDSWDGTAPPIAAKAKIYRNGRAFSAVAHYSEYVQTNRDGSPNSMWARMPANQLAKCAEALALRKAFPQDLSGVFTDEEMAAQDNVPPPPQTARVTIADLTPVDTTTGEIVEPQDETLPLDGE